MTSAAATSGAFTSSTTTSTVAEDDLIPLSALQHYLFCPRQCALIHVEQQWEENLYTAEGRILHRKTEVQDALSRGDDRIVHGMAIRSFALGVAGIADVVELRRAGGALQPFPVEYKRGRPKVHRADEVQLCAQALCLEEMFEVRIAEGALFYGKTRRRKTVPLDEDLRTLTRQVAAATRAMIASGRTPPPIYDKKRCDTCSMLGICRPQRLSRHSSVGAWLARHVDKA
ncbi:MAG: CRISPR-associated protein Cas4 [Rhodospirillales bacterium]|nr:CRISPR-associated protein Cas4 [Rhodospirillales bacterium]